MCDVSGDNAGANYTAGDLAKEIEAILLRLERPIRPDALVELTQGIDPLVQSQHESAHALSDDVRRAEAHIDTAEAARARAHEVITQYALKRFPSSAGGGAAISARQTRGRLTVPPPPPPPRPSAVTDEPGRDENAILAEIAAATREPAESFAERMRTRLEAVREWLRSFIAGLADFINRAAGQSKQWMLAHRKQIDAVFSGFGILTGLFGTQIKWLLPILDLLTNGAATPTWFAVQFGMLTAKTAWRIIKGEDDLKAEAETKADRRNKRRLLRKKEAFAFMTSSVDIFVEYKSLQLGSYEYALRFSGAALKYVLQLIKGPSDGESKRKLVLKETFGFAVDTLDIFKDDIFKEGRLPVALGGLLEMRSKKSLAKDLYEYVEPRAKWAQTRRQIQLAPRIVPREEWRREREGRVRRWLLDKGEYIEGSLLQINATKTLFGAEVGEIIALTDGFTGGIATRAWLGIQLGIACANFSWRIIRGDSHGGVTASHIKRQFLWAGIEVLGIFQKDLGLEEISETIELANNVRFANEWLGYTKRYIFSGNR